MPQSLLYGNGRDRSQPRILFLEIREHGRKIVVGEALSMLKRGCFTLRETPVVDKADISCHLSGKIYGFSENVPRCQALSANRLSRIIWRSFVSRSFSALRFFSREILQHPCHNI